MGRRGKELTSEEKRTILSLIESGLKAVKVAELLKVNSSTICRFLKRFRERGDVENKHRSGRPRSITARGQTALSRIVKKDRRESLSDITKEYNKSVPKTVSKRTIQRELHRQQYWRRTVAKKLGVREVNRKKRLQYCRGKLTWKVDQHWKNVIFSDEMTIVIKPDGKVKVWRKTSEKWRGYCLGYLGQGPTRSLKLMVWGTITYHGSGILAFVDGNMNSQKYINVLDEHLWPVIVKYFGNSPWHFMDDNCPVHRSRETENWKRRNNIQPFFWPPQSPDLNPIENVWLVLKNHVKRRIFHIHTTDDLKRELQYAWENLSKTYIQSLYSSLPKRCRKVIASKGFITKY